MAHKGGFTLKSLNQAFVQAGFAQVLSAKRADAFDLWVFASKTAIPDDVAKGIALQYFP